MIFAEVTAVDVLVWLAIILAVLGIVYLVKRVF